MKKVMLVVFVLAGMVLVQGCAKTVTGPITGKEYLFSMWNVTKADWAYWDEIRQYYVSQHPEKEDRIKEAILEKAIVLGMEQDDVFAAWAFRCMDCLEINKTVGSWGTHEQWVLGGYDYSACIYVRIYLYFENDILIGWQD